MKFEFEVSKKSLFFILTLFVLAISSILVYAYNPTNDPEADPSVFGHSLNEIGGFNCQANEVIVLNGGKWQCSSVVCAPPKNSISLFTSDCPNGYERVTALDGKFPRGASTYDGTTGGSNSHNHTLNNTYAFYRGGSPGDYPGYLFNLPTYPTSQNATAIPPYLDVVWCKKD